MDCNFAELSTGVIAFIAESYITFKQLKFSTGLNGESSILFASLNNSCDLLCDFMEKFLNF